MNRCLLLTCSLLCSLALSTALAAAPPPEAPKEEPKADAAEGDKEPVVYSPVVSTKKPSEVKPPKPRKGVYTLRGGGFIEPTDAGFSVDVGFPRIDANYYFRVREGLELSPELSLFYGLGATTPIVGGLVGCEVRYQVHHEDKLRVQLYAEPGLLMVVDPDTVAGLRIGAPGVLVSYQALDKGFVLGGLKISPVVLFADDTLLSFPVLATVGGEFQLYRDYNLFVSLEFGPDIRKISGQDTKSYLYVNTVFGIAKAF
jgi:hypothetical protein